uniref:translation initiation factor IF-2-like n=1 Tax=Callithrix jacchus TaxID=9483 RepID=UPI0023DCEE7E|nr:translation initiation factor IF-2-like [Callithrix jacchus]
MPGGRSEGSPANRETFPPPSVDMFLNPADPVYKRKPRINSKPSKHELLGEAVKSNFVTQQVLRDRPGLRRRFQKARGKAPGMSSAGGREPAGHRPKPQFLPGPPSPLRVPSVRSATDTQTFCTGAQRGSPSPGSAPPPTTGASHPRCSLPRAAPSSASTCSVPRSSAAQAPRAPSPIVPRAGCGGLVGSQPRRQQRERVLCAVGAGSASPQAAHVSAPAACPPNDQVGRRSWAWRGRRARSRSGKAGRGGAGAGSGFWAWRRGSRPPSQARLGTPEAASFLFRNGSFVVLDEGERRCLSEC